MSSVAKGIISYVVMMDGEITSITGLESCIGKTPGPMHLKVIDHLDAGATRWLAASPLMIVGLASADDVDITLAGDQPGFINVVDASTIRLSKASLDRPEVAREGNGFGAVSLIPTIGETLRINGRVQCAAASRTLSRCPACRPSILIRRASRLCRVRPPPLEIDNPVVVAAAVPELWSRRWHRLIVDHFRLRLLHFRRRPRHWLRFRLRLRPELRELFDHRRQPRIGHQPEQDRPDPPPASSDQNAPSAPVWIAIARVAIAPAHIGGTR